MDPQPFGPREPQPYRVIPRRLNDPPSQHDSGHSNRAATGHGTSENTSRGGNDAQNQFQDPRHRTQVSGREPQWVHVVELSRPAGIALGLVSWSAIIGGLGALGWKFWHSQVGGEMFAEVVAGSEALMVVGRGLMGVSAAVGRGVWAVAKHYGRNPGRYAFFLCGVYQVVGAIARGAWFQAQFGDTCYCYACRVEMAQAIKRETGVSPAEILVPDNRE